MKRQALRVEPISTYLDRWKAPASPVTRAGNMIFVSGLPPFDPQTGEVAPASIERQTELILEQMKLCRDGRGLTRQRDEVQHLLHLGKTFSGREHDLRAVLSGESAGAHLRLYSGMDRPFDIEIDCIAMM